MADMREYAQSMATVRHVVEKDPHAFDHVHLVTTYADADFVLRSTDFKVLTAVDGYSRDVSAPILGGSLARIDGPAHFQRRRIEAMLFRSPTLRSNEATVLRPALERIVGDLAAIPGQGPAHADLHSISENVLGEIVAALVGLDGMDTEAGRATFDSYYQDIDNGVRISWAAENIEKLATAGLAALNRLVADFVKPAALRRTRLLEAVALGDAEPSDIPSDLITLMIEHSETFTDMDVDVMAQEIALFLTASVTTLTNQLCYCFHNIEEWVVAHPEDADRRLDGTFLSRALEESIRLHAGPVLMRRAAVDQVLPGGQLIPEGDFAWVVIRQASKDPLIFGADSDSFNPDRHVAAGALPYGVEFGIGRHTCIGKRFALGDDPNSPDALHGAGVTVLRRLYEAGMRLDPQSERTFVPELLDVHATCPIILTNI